MEDFFKLLWPSEKTPTLLTSDSKKLTIHSTVSLLWIVTVFLNQTLDNYLVSTKLQAFLKIVMPSRNM